MSILIKIRAATLSVAAIASLSMLLTAATSAYEPDNADNNNARPWDHPPPPPGPYDSRYDPWGNSTGRLPAPLPTAGNTWRQPQTDPRLLIPPPGSAPAAGPDNYYAVGIPDPNQMFHGDMPPMFPGELPRTFPGEDSPNAYTRQPGGNPWRPDTRYRQQMTPPNRWTMPQHTTERWAKPQRPSGRPWANPQRRQEWATQDTPIQWPPLGPVPDDVTYQRQSWGSVPPYPIELIPQAPPFSSDGWSQSMPDQGDEWPPLEYAEPWQQKPWPQASHAPIHQYGDRADLPPPPPIQHTLPPSTPEWQRDEFVEPPPSF